MDYLEAAKARLAEIEGEHPAWQVDSLVRVAIADALVAIAEAARHALKLVPERTCCIEYHYGEWYCHACGQMVGTCDTASILHIDGNAIELWGYCPMCGAKVVS